MTEDVRLNQIEDWLTTVLPEIFREQAWGEVPKGSLTAASSDASFRRYFRWAAEGRSLIVMDAPPPQEDCRPFVQVAGLLDAAGVHVPRILAQDLERGFLLLSDLGTLTYLEVINAANADDYFQAAIDALLAFQGKQPTNGSLPLYDRALLARELSLFPEWYVGRELDTTFSASQCERWQAVCDRLIDSALAQPQVLVHRDFMPRNLMLSTPNPGVLDFQDAVIGPVTYDITCLFKDAFLSWPEPLVQRWLLDYWEQARAAGIPVQPDFADFQRASDLMGVQRHLKVMGIFARIWHRDGKPRYVADTPRFLAYIRTVVARRPELTDLGALLDELHAARADA